MLIAVSDGDAQTEGSWYVVDVSWFDIVQRSVTIHCFHFCFLDLKLFLNMDRNVKKNTGGGTK